MSITVLVGLILGFASLIVSFVLEGGAVSALLAPTAALIVFGGTIGAVVISTPMDELKRIPGIFKVVFTEKKTDLLQLIYYFKELAAKSRKEGLLSLEAEIPNAAEKDAFLGKGLQMVVDGTEPQKIRDILENQMESIFERHKTGAKIFDDAGGFAPTMGIIGTVMGLVHVLSNLDDPKTLGPKIAVAFIATLYGVSSANLLWLPIGNKLKAINKKELNEKQLVLEAVLAIQEGLNPNTLEEQLKSFLSVEGAKSDAVQSDEKVTA